MSKINMNQWRKDIIASPQREAIPIMTHPGIEIIGATTLEAVTEGEVHFTAIKALYEKYPSAATTVIMDLTVEAEAFGSEIRFSENEVPAVTNILVCNETEIENLPVPDIHSKRVPEYLKANKLSSEYIQDKPVFSGCIGPFSLAGRLFGMTEIMMEIYINPSAIHSLLKKCTEFIKAYCLELKKSGANGVVIAEPAAGLLSNDDCSRFSSIYIKTIVDLIQDDYFSVVLHNCGNTGHCTKATLETGSHAYHFGNRIDILDALADCPEDVLVLGNIDPVQILKMKKASDIKQAVTGLLHKTSRYPNFILSTGCDTPPEVPLENIEAFYSALNEYNLFKS